MRLISFNLTIPQIRAHTKDVTRRMGWDYLKVGEQLVACEKIQGRKKGQPVVRLCVIEVVSVRKEPLYTMVANPSYGATECRREGFPHYSPSEFVDFFCASHKGCTPDKSITRIEFKFV